MHQPPGFVDPNKPNYVCHLQRSLHGLKQAPRAWFQRFASYATRVGFQHSKTDSSLFVFHRGSDIAYLLLYVDDIFLIASSSAFLQRIITSLHKEILSELIARSCNPCRTPVDTESKLGSDSDPVSDPTLYRSLAGALQYLTFTRPDLSYAVQQLHVSSTTQLSAYTDADWAGCPVTRRAEAEYRGCFANVVLRTAWILQHQRTKHIQIDIHFVRVFVASGQVRVLHVPSRFQYADIFMKGYPLLLFIVKTTPSLDAKLSDICIGTSAAPTYLPSHIIPIDLYPCRVEEKLIMRKLEGKWIMKKEIRMISKDGTISEFPGYTSSKEEKEEEEEEDSEKKGSKEALKMGSNSESSGYAASDNEVESDLGSTARSGHKCNEMKDTCESGVRPKPDSS
ncbi:ribonuclease H-like domain-containing protein [Tanacetum coccineum]|uniref:Ribonuclease H-like domain-containing protein n=1 Tax=Tanacetum coccineum TaxID=301880 RepID=A0ABQ5C167_9ASTR